VANEHGGRFPDSEKELLKLPGIGRYTAAAIAAIAFGRRAVVVDANVERVISRLFAVKEPLPRAREKLYALAGSITPDAHCGDFAQGMMDLGATICTPRNPACGICPLGFLCEARRQGRQEMFPMKSPKAARPHKQGIAYWLQHEDHVLLVRRPGKGLLGGMLALPTSSWTGKAEPGDGAPAEAKWSETGALEHVFTHFALSLRVYRAQAERRDEGIWWPVGEIEQAGLPTVFAKAAARARA
jgi:A/G-specific adenine glycosylase